jgi:putative PEP-CTERM system integral membrane protein
MVHLGDDISIGYDDQTLQAIQASGGGVAGDVETALQRLAVSLYGSDQSTYQPATASDLLDGYLWTALPTEQANAALITGPVEIHNPQDGFASLAARRLILAEMQRNRGTIDQLDTLDYLHSLATQYGIVTPYSSMIVLVNAQQQQLLDRLSNLQDRYEREVESLGETAPASPVPLAGVPEPHEWLLMGLAAAILVYYVYTKRKPALVLLP